MTDKAENKDLSAQLIYKVLNEELRKIKSSDSLIRKIALNDPSVRDLVLKIDLASKEAYKLSEIGDYNKAAIFTVLLHKKVSELMSIQ